jgi:hypothetical protein
MKKNTKPQKTSKKTRKTLTVAQQIRAANDKIERVALAPRVTPHVFTLNSTQATNVSGYLTVAAFSSALINSCSDFSSVANMFLEYRVIAMELIFSPYYPNNYLTFNPPAKVSMCAWNGGTSPSTYQQVCDGTNPMVFNARDKMTYSVSADMTDASPNLAWNSISIGVPVANSFGIAFGAEAAGPAFTASTVWASYTLRILGEFKYAG